MNLKENGIELYHGDCLEVMNKLIEQGVKVDMILCDLPYGQLNKNMRGMYGKKVIKERLY